MSVSVFIQNDIPDDIQGERLVYTQLCVQIPINQKCLECVKLQIVDKLHAVCLAGSSHKNKLDHRNNSMLS